MYGFMYKHINVNMVLHKIV